MSRRTTRKSDSRNNPTLGKYITLRPSQMLVPQFDGEDPPYAFVQASRMYPRDYPDQQAAELLLWRTLGEVMAKPPGQEFCSDCGEWRMRSYFANNPAHPRGCDYVCKQCTNDRRRHQREVAAFEQSREVRRYYKPKAA